MVACCTKLWADAAAKWPELGASASPSEHATDLAAALVNTMLRTCLYDPVGRLRAAAMAALLPLSQALKAEEVLKLAVLKCRDKDKDTRRHALRVMAALARQTADSEHAQASLAGDADEQQDAAGEVGSGGLGRQLSVKQLQALVLHGTCGPAATEASRALASASFRDHLVEHQGRAAAALAELRVLEQIELYEPLLRDGPIEELFAMAFPAAAGGADAADDAAFEVEDELGDEVEDE